MSTLLRAIGSEFLKLLTTRMWWVLALVMTGYVAIAAGGLGAAFGYLSEHPDAARLQWTRRRRRGADGIRARSAHLRLRHHGRLRVPRAPRRPLAATGEFRHATLTPTFLATPRRGLVLLAKVKVLVIFGAVFGVIAWAATIAAGAATLGAAGLPTGLDSSDTWALAGRGILAMALWASIGVGLGTLVTSQVATIVIVLAFTQFVEPLLCLAAGFIPATADIARFLPGAASDALVGASFFTINGSTQADALDWWAGGLVLLGYAVVLTVLGYLVSWRRDVS